MSSLCNTNAFTNNRLFQKPIIDGDKIKRSVSCIDCSRELSGNINSIVIVIVIRLLISSRQLSLCYQRQITNTKQIRQDLGSLCCRQDCLELGRRFKRGEGGQWRESNQELEPSKIYEQTKARVAPGEQKWGGLDSNPFVDYYDVQPKCFERDPKRRS